MPEFWLCMIILHFWQAFDDNFGSKWARVWNMAHLNISDYGSIICLNNAWICLNMPLMFFNMPEYCWMSLNMPENTWINCSGYAILRKSIDSNWFKNVLLELFSRQLCLHFFFIKWWNFIYLFCISKPYFCQTIFSQIDVICIVKIQ